LILIAVSLAELVLRLVIIPIMTLEPLLAMGNYERMLDYLSFAGIVKNLLAWLPVPGMLSRSWIMA
jgi:uncharacterized membrane protein